MFHTQQFILYHDFITKCERRTSLTIASRVNTYCDQLENDMPETAPTPSLIVAPWKLHPRKVSSLFKKKKTEVSRQEIQQSFAIFRAEHHEFQFIYTEDRRMTIERGMASSHQDSGACREGCPITRLFLQPNSTQFS